jgi:hypothetical protein
MTRGICLERGWLKLSQTDTILTLALYRYDCKLLGNDKWSGAKVSTKSFVLEVCRFHSPSVGTYITPFFVLHSGSMF